MEFGQYSADVARERRQHFHAKRFIFRNISIFNLIFMTIVNIWIVTQRT